MNGLSNSGCARAEADVSASFNESNELCCGSYQLNFVSFRISNVGGLLMAAKSLIKDL
jgi:hypothetical protein